MKSMAEIFRSYATFENGRHVNGTDKQSNHAYGDAYEKILQVLGPEGRNSVKLMLEVGVADGSSLLAWQEALPNATVVGMDIHPASRWKGEFHLGDQRDKLDCEKAAAGRQFDLIVEDATHNLANTLVTLLYLWPAVRPGGLYIVEEFAQVHELRSVLLSLFRGVSIVDTQGPFGGSEPLVVLRKPS